MPAVEDLLENNTRPRYIPEGNFQRHITMYYQNHAFFALRHKEQTYLSLLNLLKKDYEIDLFSSLMIVLYDAI